MFPDLPRRFYAVRASLTPRIRCNAATLQTGTVCGRMRGEGRSIAYMAQISLARDGKIAF